MEEKWYKLDNAAKIYPVIREANWAPVYRVSAIVKDEVNPEVLQRALMRTYRRFPTFAVHIRKGAFWYYFEPNESEPQVLQETKYPASPFCEDEDRGYLFRVLYYGRRISLEVFHSISDGFGAAVFIKTLLYNYFTILKNDKDFVDPLKLDSYGILYHKDLPTAEETEDSFLHYALRDAGLKLHENTAYKIPGTRVKKNTVRVTHVLFSTSALKNLGKEYDSTITEFLTSLLINSIFHSRIYSASENKPIKISVPVNLRSRFPSNTLRNFSSYINVEVFPKAGFGNMKLEDICTVVKRQINQGLSYETLLYKFSSNVNAERNVIMRLAPLFLKNIVLKTTFSLYGERITTSTLSNIGNIVLPDEMASEIERFDVVLGAPRQNAMNCGVVSYNDKMSISFTSIIMENSIIKTLVDFLVGRGVDVKIETNY